MKKYMIKTLKIRWRKKKITYMRNDKIKIINRNIK